MTGQNTFAKGAKVFFGQKNSSPSGLPRKKLFSATKTCFLGSSGKIPPVRCGVWLSAGAVSEKGYVG